MALDWLQECSQPTDEQLKMFSDFGSLRYQLDVPKEHFLFLYPDDDAAAVRSACFLHWLFDNIDLQELNIAMWVSNDMKYTTESGPWTKTIYKDSQQKTFCTVGQIAEHLNIPTENVLFLVPGDEFMQVKIGEFVSNFICKYKWSNHTALTWFKSKDNYHPRVLRRML